MEKFLKRQNIVDKDGLIILIQIWIRVDGLINRIWNYFVTSKLMEKSGLRYLHF